jgi:phosphatidylserine/phosphatidylglycerophosphate/cardiolipin synthase-like enzyme
MSLNRFNSFAPLRYASSFKFYVDGCDYFDAVAAAFENANKSILIMGWMISP